MIINGENLNHIKDIVKSVRKRFAGLAARKPKDTEKQCSESLVPHVYKKQMNSILSTPYKAGILLFCALVVSRLLPLPANSEPLLGLAVLIPYLTKSNLGFLMMPAVMLVSDMFLGLGSWMLYTYSALAIAPFISKLLDNKY